PNQYGNQFYTGEKPFSDVARPPTSQYNGNINLSGPILKHTLWFAFSYEYRNQHAGQPAGPPLNQQAPNRIFISNYLRAKVTWAPSTQHRLTATTVADPANIDFVGFNGLTANTTLPIAANRQEQGGIVGNILWEYFITQNISTKLQAGVQFNKL